jgi:hypothetical protein
MEIKSSTYVVPVAQNTKPEPTKQIADEITKNSTAKLQDDIVTLSSTGGGHPERPTEPKPKIPPKT